MKASFQLEIAVGGQGGPTSVCRVSFIAAETLNTVQKENVWKDNASPSFFEHLTSQHPSHGIAALFLTFALPS